MTTSRNRRRQALNSDRRLQIEPLEPRRVLAGNVTAAVVDGTLRIVGDAEGNNIQITFFGHELSVSSSASDSTTINGSAGPATFNGPFRGVFLSLGNGDDRVRVEEHVLVPDSSPTTGPELEHFTVDLGAGNDQISAFSVDADLVLASGGEGDDFISLSVQNAAHVLVRAGAGNNSIGIDAETSQNVRVEGNIGRDTVQLSGTANAAIHTGDGEDSVTLGSTGRVAVFLGEHNDTFRAVNTIGASLLVDAAGGSDEVTIAGMAIAGDVQVLGGAGDEGEIVIGGSHTFTSTQIGVHPLRIGGDLVVDLGEGDNGGLFIGGVTPEAVTSDTQISGELRVLGGGGFDSADLQTLTAGSLAINLGPGDSRLLMNAALVQRSVLVQGGGGEDRWNFNALAVRGNMSVASGAGIDSLRFNTDINLPTDIGRSLLVNTGDGNDSVSTGVQFIDNPPPNQSQLSAQRIQIATGLGHDSANLKQLRASQEVFAALGDDDDRLTLLDSAAPQGRFNGGPGVDTFTAERNFMPIQKVNFEG